MTSSSSASNGGGGGLFYILTIGFIRAYKSFEAVIIRFFLGFFEKLVRKSYRDAGIEIDGPKPWDIKVHNKPEFFLRMTNHAPLGLGETYVEGVWDCDDMVELNYRTMRKGNDLFESFLDPTMNYSCGYWKSAKNLFEAQTDKMDLIAKKLMLRPGMRVLDIGCGWGGLSKHLADNYGVRVVGITVSKEGFEFARNRCSKLPVDIRLMDYRDLNEQFDRIVSVGMFEHVGPTNYKSFFDTVERCLKESGLFLLHTIGVSHADFPLADAWFDKYIFPNGILPYHKDITEYIDKRFILEDWQNFGHDYSKTLLAWFENFSKNWHKIESKYGDKFFRLWTYYLLMGSGCFKARRLHLWQVVLSKNGIENGYYAAR